MLQEMVYLDYDINVYYQIVQTLYILSLTLPELYTHMTLIFTWALTT